jgi:hypothetical protein
MLTAVYCFTLLCSFSHGEGAVQAEKQMQAGGNVSEEGQHFAKLSASKTAASILTKTVEHHRAEAQQEADVAEAYEYRDSIKADIKAWAFQVLPLLYTKP